jgi:hypothetical protein
LGNSAELLRQLVRGQGQFALSFHGATIRHEKLDFLSTVVNGEVADWNVLRHQMLFYLAGQAIESAPVPLVELSPICPPPYRQRKNSVSQNKSRRENFGFMFASTGQGIIRQPVWANGHGLVLI